MEKMGLQIIAGVELILLVLCFILMKTVAKYGNAQGWEHHLAACTGSVKSGLLVCLPSISLPYSGSDHEDSYGRVKYLNVSVTRLCHRANAMWGIETIIGIPCS